MLFLQIPGPTPRTTTHGPSPWWVLAILMLPGCLSPEEALSEADQEVYALVSEQRNAIFDDALPFSIDPPIDSLRQRLLSGAVSAEVGIPDLTLADCLEIAAENSRNYQTRKEQLYLSALDLTLEQWRFGWQFNLGGSSTTSGPGLNTATSQNADLNGSMQKLFGNGGLAVANIGASLFRALATGDGWDAISNLGISFTQPLLRGSAREVVVEPLTQAQRNLVYETRTFERFRRTFGIDVATRYYRLLLTRQTVVNERDNRASLELVSDRNTAFAEAGKLSEIQVSQAVQEVLTSRNRLITLENRLEGEFDSFKLFLGLPIETKISLDESALEDLFIEETAAMLQEWTEHQLTVLALTQRLDFLNSIEQVQDAERQTRIVADTLRTGLGVTGTLNEASAEGRPLSYSDDRLPWSIRFNLDLPVDLIPERNSYRRSLVRLQAQLRNHQQLLDTIRSDLRRAVRDTDSTKRIYDLQEITVEMNERRVKSATMNLEAGRAETRDLLDAQRNYVTALNAADAALVDFTLARLDLFQQLELLTFSETGLGLDTDRLTQGPPEIPSAPVESISK
jgi:outer membrane protein TolC